MGGFVTEMDLGQSDSVTSLQQKFLDLKRDRKAVVLAHNYQPKEIQEVADYVGDSLGLSYEAQKAKGECILFCGVHFMAETAKIVNPEKKVLMPDLNAGCSLADSCPADELQAYRNQNPGLYVVSYVNCSAAVKAQSDVICTSGNAERIVQRIPKDREILFLPDRNLGDWVMQKTGRKMRLWDGDCYVHMEFTASSIDRIRREHPEARVVAHPECTRAVRALADEVCSTEKMVGYCRNSSARTFIVVTEEGMLHRLRREMPDREFIAGPTDRCACGECRYMKMNTLEKAYGALESMTAELVLSQEIVDKAKAPIERMLDWSRN
jgi:quinolinate synthase